MPATVELIAGAAQTGKTQMLLERYCQRLLTGQAVGRCCWLSPNHVAAAEIQQRLLDSADRAILAPGVFTFDRFAEALIKRSPQRVRYITSAQKRRLLQQVIRSAARRQQLDHFARVATTPGFVSQVDTFIAEQKRANTSPEEYGERYGHADQRRRELGLLYAAYQKQLHEGDLYDSEGRFWAAREILSSTSAKHAYDLVVVNGFNDFTIAQYQILRLLRQRSAELVFSLMHECSNSETVGGTLEFAKTRDTLEQLRESFPPLRVEPLQATAPTQSTLRLVQHRLFREACDEVNERAVGLEIVAAHHELGEVEAIAERVKSLLQTGQAAPHEIVVVPCGGEAAAVLLDAVLPDYGIPYYAEHRSKLEIAPLLRALQALLRLHMEDWPFQTLLEVVGNRLFAAFDAEDPTAEYATQPRPAVEACLRSAQLPSGKAPLLEQLEYRSELASTNEPGKADELAAQLDVARELLNTLAAALDALPAEASLSQWATALEQLLARLGALDQRTARQSRESVAWNLLQRGLRDLERIDLWSHHPQQSLPLQELQEAIAAVAREQQLPAQNDEVGCVRLLKAESARKLSIKHLFLAGLSEQSFSSTVVVDAESASEVKESDAAPTPEPQPKRDDGRLLFYELVTRPSESLTLSYAALDAKGQPLSPSPLLTELERSVGEDRISHTTLSLSRESDEQAKPHSVSAFRQQAVEQALAGKQGWLAGMLTDEQYARTGSAVLAGIDCVAQRSTRDLFGSHEGLLLGDTAQAVLARRFDPNHLWSPSQLESYAACPFRFFGEQLLKLEPLGELALRNDPRRRGSLLHQVLATVHQQLNQAGEEETGSELDAADLLRRFVAALQEAVRATPLRGLEQSLREIERREIETWAPGYAEQEIRYRDHWKHLDEPLRPTMFEVRFGPNKRGGPGEYADPASSPLPFELDLGEEKIRLTGQIDRVDVGSAAGVTVFNIIDYKTGQEVKLKHDKLRSGRQLQLPLYALAAEQLLMTEADGVTLATGYWNIRGNGFFTGKKDNIALQLRELNDSALQMADDWQQLQPDILERVRELIRGVRAGEFPVYNDDKNCTRSCSLSTICRIGQIRSLEKVWTVENEVRPNDQ